LFWWETELGYLKSEKEVYKEANSEHAPNFKDGKPSKGTLRKKNGKNFQARTKKKGGEGQPPYTDKQKTFWVGVGWFEENHKKKNQKEHPQ